MKDIVFEPIETTEIVFEMKQSTSKNAGGAQYSIKEIHVLRPG